MWRGDVILARGDMRTVALHHIIPVKGKQACEPKSFHSLRKLDRRTRIVHALEVSESSSARKLRDRKPSLFNTFEIFDHTRRLRPKTSQPQFAEFFVGLRSWSCLAKG